MVVGAGWAGTLGAGVGVGVGVGLGVGVSLGATGCRFSFCFARAACAAACFSWVLLRFLAFFCRLFLDLGGLGVGSVWAGVV